MDPYAHPQGPAGARAGRVMAIQNAEAERAAARALPTGRVLEIGCGPGVGLARLGPRGVGIDLSRPMVEQARQAAPAAGLVQGDARVLPFPDATFQGAMAVHCLALLPAGALQEIRRVLVADAPMVAVHRGPEQGGPDPEDMEARMRAARFRDVHRSRGAGRWMLHGRA